MFNFKLVKCIWIPRKMLKSQFLIICFIIGTFQLYTVNANDETKTTTKSVEDPSTPAATATLATTTTTAADATKDKRQIGAKETQVYPNHRSDSHVDDPEDGQETIYGAKPNQFLIRPIAPHQHQQHEEHQQPQLRNYPVTIRPHSQQLLEQSQEIQHFAYLQDLSRKQAVKSSKADAAPSKKSARPAAQAYSSSAAATEEAEQRYAYAVQTPGPQPRHFQPSTPYQLPASRQSPTPQQQQQQLQQQYQVIPEEQFLKLIEEELQARAYHDEQLRQQQQHQHQQQHHQQHQQQQQQQQQQQARQSQRESIQHPALGLGSYRQRVAAPPVDDYIQYIPRQRGGPKYLPEPQNAQTSQEAAADGEPSHEQPAPPPPQLAYYTPQISYKTLPNHPLAKSSLEKEIEKLLAANKNSHDDEEPLVDNSNEPSALINQHHQAPLPRPLAPAPTQRHPQRPLLQPKGGFFSSTTPNTLLDANNQPFIPSLFQFSNYQQPTPIYPTQLPPQQHLQQQQQQQQELIDAKKLGPVVYPSATPTSQPAQPSQYYYQQAAPTPKANRPYRAKQYGNKIPSATSALQPGEKQSKLLGKYAQPLQYTYERQPQTQTGPVQFFPSPQDPNTQQQQPPSPRPTQPSSQPPPPDFRQYALPAAAPSQSSIYVSQGTGITTPSRPIHRTHKPKTADDVKQLRLPQTGGDKPLTQAEFQALVDAGYPVTAVPVPVPVPYEQYIKQHPEYRSREYAPMRLAHAQYAPQQQQHQQLQQHQHYQQQPSEPAVKIVSSPTEQKTATAIGGGGITYLRPVAQGRRARDEQETAVEGKKQLETTAVEK